MTQQQADRMDTQQEMIGVLRAIALLVAAVIFLMWVHRVCRNLLALGSSKLKYSPGWCVGSYFVPILSLFRPYQGMVQIWKGSSPEPDDLNDSRWDSAASTPLLGLWWAAWIGSNYVGYFGGFSASNPNNFAAMKSATVLAMLVNVLSIVAAGLLIVLVHQIDKRQSLRYERINNPSVHGQDAEVATFADPYS